MSTKNRLSGIFFHIVRQLVYIPDKALKHLVRLPLHALADTQQALRRGDELGHKAARLGDNGLLLYRFGLGDIVELAAQQVKARAAVWRESLVTLLVI